jgi:hypothetical protein
MNGNSFVFPVGDNSANIGAAGLVNVGGIVGIQDWKVTYHYSNPTSVGFDATNFASPISQICKTEYWDIQGPIGGTTAVKIIMDGSSDVASSRLEFCY